MKQEKTVVMVSTSKPATVNQIVSRKSDNRLAIVNVLTVEDPNRHLHTTQHLYILSDEKVKNGDWYVVELFKITGESDGLHLEQCKKIEDVWVNNFDVVQTRHKDNCKKVIATTNPDLWKKENDGSKENQQFAQYLWDIPKIGLDFVERFVKEWNKGNEIEKVMIEYLNTGGFCNEVWELKIRSNGTVIISPVEERKYTKMEIMNSLHKAELKHDKDYTKIWVLIEQNLPK